MINKNLYNIILIIFFGMVGSQCSAEFLNNIAGVLGLHTISRVQFPIRQLVIRHIPPLVALSANFFKRISGALCSANISRMQLPTQQSIARYAPSIALVTTGTAVTAALAVPLVRYSMRRRSANIFGTRDVVKPTVSDSNNQFAETEQDLVFNDDLMARIKLLDQYKAVPYFMVAPLLQSKVRIQKF